MLSVIYNDFYSRKSSVYTMSTKYNSYKKGQSYVPIPKKVAKRLGWEHLDEILIDIKEFEGKTGIFLTKKDVNKKVEKTV